MVTGQYDWDEFRRQFPVTRNYIYFNHAAIAPFSQSVKRQISKCLEQYCENGILCNRKFLEIVDYTRELAARFIGAKPSEIAFIKNTTQGILIAANGIRWKRGDNVLIPDKEFPANVYPWLNLTKRGVEVKFVPVKNGRFSVADIDQYIDKKTRALSLSAVSFLNGFRCDLMEIGRLCKDHGIFFIVDAIQALGAIEVNVKKSFIDLLSADAHKWLLGPQGIGILYVSEAVLESLDVSNLGWKSMNDEGNYLKYEIRIKSNAARFEEGTLNILGIIGLKASLEMILGIGIPVIEKRILKLTRMLIKGLVDRGYIIKSPMDFSERSGILAFCHNAFSTKTILDRLFQANVVCAQRDGAIRISPHFYNNKNDINGFLKALP